jgi:hypothetical protein
VRRFDIVFLSLDGLMLEFIIFYDLAGTEAHSFLLSIINIRLLLEGTFVGPRCWRARVIREWYVIKPRPGRGDVLAGE